MRGELQRYEHQGFRAFLIAMAGVLAIVVIAAIVIVSTA
jgi:hypothetical protein